MHDRNRDGRRGERGFALVLAILSLMLLTFLGLTMAATTSTELQIATNYRWSQQALYNAEAGLEVARVVLATVGGNAQSWSAQLPVARTTDPGWTPAAPGAPYGTQRGRDFERWECDSRGLGVGNGLVLSDGTTFYENVTTYPNATDKSLNGAFTVWVRRPLVANNDGTYKDESRNDVLLIVSEGVAPYTGDFAGQASALLRSRQAVRVLETRFTLGLTNTVAPCGLGSYQGQEGLSPMGENFNPCVNVTAGLGGTLGDVFGQGSDHGSLDRGAKE
jgi:hypothetical protein